MILRLLFLIIFYQSVLGNEPDQNTNNETITVEIEQREKNSSLAKDKALKSAARSAFEKYLYEIKQKSTKLETYLIYQLHLISKTESEFIDSITDKEISDCTLHYSVNKEKFSEQRYIANVTYAFKGKAIIKLIRKKFGNSSNEENNDTDLNTVAIHMKDYFLKYDSLEKYNKYIISFGNGLIKYQFKDKVLKSFRTLI